MQTSSHFRHTAVLLGLTIALGAFPWATSAQGSSTNYMLHQQTLNGGGGGGGSVPAGTYRMEDSLGQESVIGCSSSFHYVLQSGFWSYQGTGLVSVVLTLTKNIGFPNCPDLVWTGNNPGYWVYRSVNPDDVFSHQVLSNPDNDWTDGAPPDAPVVYYNVLATAPGPIPPGMDSNTRIFQAGDP